MASEQLASGFQDGFLWSVDHDDVAGTIGVVVSGSPVSPGQLLLHAQAFTNPGNVLLLTINPIRIDTFSGLGRQVLVSNNALKSVVLSGNSPAVILSLWTTFGA